MVAYAAQSLVLRSEDSIGGLLYLIPISSNTDLQSTKVPNHFLVDDQARAPKATLSEKMTAVYTAFARAGIHVLVAFFIGVANFSKVFVLQIPERVPLDDGVFRIEDWPESPSWYNVA